MGEGNSTFNMLLYLNNDITKLKYILIVQKHN